MEKCKCGDNKREDQITCSMCFIESDRISNERKIIGLDSNKKEVVLDNNYILDKKTGYYNKV